MGTPTTVFDASPVIDALRNADGPVLLIAGEQVARDDARAELERLRSTLKARVATVPDAIDVSTNSLGVCGVMGHPSVAAAATQSAICLLVGTRMTVTARAGLDDVLSTVPTYSIGSAPPHLPCTHVHSDDLRGALSSLAAAVTDDGADGPEPVPRSELQPPPHHGAGMRYRDAMGVLDTALPDDTDIVVDAGNIGAAAIHYLPARRHGRFLVALGMGGMGHSFGAGIGLTFHRGHRTVVITGDGSFLMHGMEIHTAVQYRLPITFLLFDNHAHAMCVTREQLFYGDRYSYNRFGHSRYGAGLDALDVTDIAQLPAALRLALACDGPSVVAIDCSPNEIPPFAAFLTTKEEPRVTARAH